MNYVCYNESIHFSDRIGGIGWKEIKISNLVNYACFEMVMKFGRGDTGAKHPETLKAYPISFPYYLPGHPLSRAPEAPGTIHALASAAPPEQPLCRASWDTQPIPILDPAAPQGCSLHGLPQDTPACTYFSFSFPSWTPSILGALGLPQPIPTSTSAILPVRPLCEESQDCPG